MEYFKKLKEAIKQPQNQSFGIIEDIKESTSLLNRIRQIESNNRELMVWKDSEAIPTMKKNIEDIKIAISEIKTLSYKATQASTMATQAAEVANASVAGAKDALSKATDVYEKFQKAAAQLDVDTKALGEASNMLIASMETEIRAVKEQFITFGTKVYNSARIIGTNMGYAGKELVEAYEQIKYPLARVQDYASRIAKDKLIGLPYNIVKIWHWGFTRG